MIISTDSLENLSVEPFHPSLDGVYIGATRAVAVGDSPAVTAVELPKVVTLPVQTHTANVAFAEDICPDVSRQADAYRDTDGLITLAPMQGVGVRTADCVPLMLYAADIKACVAVHAGWRGTIGNIATHAVEMMVARGAAPQNIFARFGACICGDCYEVDAVLAERFGQAGYAAMVRRKDNDAPLSSVLAEGESSDTDKYLLNLSGVNRLQLLDCGVLPHHINSLHDCTLHSLSPSGELLYHSWRKNPGLTQRNITFVWRG